jgi:hypothetical protein
MRSFQSLLLIGGTVAAIAAACGKGVDGAGQLSEEHSKQPPSCADGGTAESPLITDGRQIFRFDTFSSEHFWGDKLQLHKALAGDKNGGVGPGVSPKTALAVGLKVDSEAVPADVAAAIQAGQVDLDDPANTVLLLKVNAVVGVKGFFDSSGMITSMGIECAFCHSTVDDSFAPGIGKRLDGWPNRDLDVGKIVSLAPNPQVLLDMLGVDAATLQTVLLSWGPGRYDAELLLDGKAFRPDGKSASTVIPAAFGLAGVNLATYTGFGSVPYWNAYVANTQMHGEGTFVDMRLNDASRWPLAVKNHLFEVRNPNDVITSKLPALHVYQMSLAAPKAPQGMCDAVMAKRGESVFNGKAKCSSCHVPTINTEPGWNMHSAAEIGIDDFQAMRSPDGKYRTTPLKGLFTKMKGGFYHDGRFATLDDVVAHYDQLFGLGLSSSERADLVEYLKSL